MKFLLVFLLPFFLILAACDSEKSPELVLPLEAQKITGDNNFRLPFSYGFPTPKILNEVAYYLIVSSELDNTGARVYIVLDMGTHKHYLVESDAALPIGSLASSQISPEDHSMRLQRFYYPNDDLSRKLAQDIASGAIKPSSSRIRILNFKRT